MEEKTNMWNKYWSSYKGVSYQAWLLLTAILINRIGYMGILFSSLYLKTILHFSLSQVGLLLASYGLGNIGGTFFGGILSDHIRPIYLLIITFMLTAILLVLFPLIGNFYLLTGLLLLLGMFGSIGQPASNIALNSYVNNENRLKVFGLYRVINNIGVSIAGFLGGYLASFNFKYLFYVNSISMAIAAFTLLVLKQKITDIDSTSGNEPVKNISLKEVLNDKYFMLIWWLLLGSLIIFAQATTTYPIYLNQTYNLDVTKVGLIFALNGLIIAIFQVPLLSYLKTLNLSRVASIGILLIGIAFGLLPFGNGFFFAAGSCVIWTIGEMLTFPVSMTLVMNHIDKFKKGRYMSVYHTAISISSLLFPLSGMFIYQHLGSRVLWSICLMLGIILMFGYLSLNRQYELAREAT